MELPSCSLRMLLYVVLLSRLPASATDTRMNGQHPQKLPCTGKSCLNLCLQVAFMPVTWATQGDSSLLSSWTESITVSHRLGEDHGFIADSSLPHDPTPHLMNAKQEGDTCRFRSTCMAVAWALLPAWDSRQPLSHLEATDGVPSACQRSAVNFERLST